MITDVLKTISIIVLCWCYFTYFFPFRKVHKYDSWDFDRFSSVFESVFLFWGILILIRAEV